VPLRTHAEHGGLQMTDGTLTLTDALLQEAYICACVGDAARDYNSRPTAPISLRLILVMQYYIINVLLK